MKYKIQLACMLAAIAVVDADMRSFLPAILNPLVVENGHRFERPAIEIRNRSMVYSTNGSIFHPPNAISVLQHDAVLDLGRKYIQSSQKDYFVVRLGAIKNSTWNTQLYEDFTTVIDNAHYFHNLLGFTIESALDEPNLPFFKAAVRDMKRYMSRNKMRRIPVGLELNSQLNTTTDQYLGCNTPYPVDFYFSQNGLSFPTPKQGPCPTNMSICTTTLPHTPRSARCDCIMSALHCMINPVVAKQGINELDRFCDTVYCGSIENDVTTGRYGIFASCSNLQKHSIALNLYYTFHGNQSYYCQANGLGTLVAHNYSIENYQQLQDYNGKSCKQEIMDDWSRFLVGRPRKQMITSNERDNVNEDIDNDDFDRVPNSAPALKYTNGLNLLLMLLIFSI